MKIVLHEKYLLYDAIQYAMQLINNNSTLAKAYSSGSKAYTEEGFHLQSIHYYVKISVHSHFLRFAHKKYLEPGI